MASVSIPVKGTKKFRNAVDAFARETNTTMADITREAIDEKLGKIPRFREMLVFFGADVHQNEQSEKEMNKNA